MNQFELASREYFSFGAIKTLKAYQIFLKMKYYFGIGKVQLKEKRMY